MKKVLFIAGAVLLIAAACNKQTASTGQEATTPTPVTPVTETPTLQKVSPTKVDAAVTALDASVDSEDAINVETDDDVINSDQSLINNFDGESDVKF